MNPFNNKSRLSEGIWLVKDNGNSSQQIAKLGDLIDAFPYAQMAIDIDVLANFIRTKFNQYFSDSLQLTKDGGIRYYLPSVTDMAKDILKFLSLPKEQKEKTIKDLSNKIRRLDKKGNVLDDSGNIIHKSYTAEAILYKIEELKKEIKYYERAFEDKCIELLTETDTNNEFNSF